MFPRIFGCTSVALLLLGISACETDPVGKTVPVKGKVMANDKPLTRGSVAYWPDEGKGNKSAFAASAEIAADGTYELKTRNKPGAPLGAYKVTVISQSEADSTKPTTAQSLVPANYNTKDKTPLEKEVVENAPAGAYDLEIK